MQLRQRIDWCHRNGLRCHIYMYQIDIGRFTMVFGQLVWLTIRSGLLWRWRHRWYNDHRRLYVCATLFRCRVCLFCCENEISATHRQTYADTWDISVARVCVSCKIKNCLRAMVNRKNKVEDGSGGVGLGLGATAKLSSPHKV